MNWDDLRIFLSVARSESLSLAGKALRIDPATVGRRINRLESSIGTPLFVKSQRGYSLTEEGTRLVAHAEQVENAVANATGEVAGQSGQLSGQVRIGATDGCASYILPQVCADISQKHPELELQIVALPRVINLSKREADLAITVSPPSSGRLTTQKITDYGLSLAGSRSYLASVPEIRRKEDLRYHPLVGYIQDLIAYPELDFLDKLGVKKVSLASNLVSVQLGMVQKGGGLGVTHDFIFPSAPDLVKVLPDEISFQRSFYLIRHNSDAQIERFARVAELLSSGVRGEIARLEKTPVTFNS